MVYVSPTYRHLPISKDVRPNSSIFCPNNNPNNGPRRLPTGRLYPKQRARPGPDAQRIPASAKPLSMVPPDSPSAPSLPTPRPIRPPFSFSLAVFGNLVGRGPHCMVDATRHSLNLYVVLVGDSSKARKGTSWSQIARLFAEVDQTWFSTRITSARPTANGLVSALRDEPSPTAALLVLSEEFASVLHTLKCGNGHLSPMLRCAWDSGDLSAPDMQQHSRATGNHISLIAHITQRELAQNLRHTETQNGFANRCLWTWVHRSSCIPDGGTLSAGDLAPIARDFRRALDWAAATPEILLL